MADLIRHATTRAALWLVRLGALIIVPLLLALSLLATALLFGALLSYAMLLFGLTWLTIAAASFAGWCRDRWRGWGGGMIIAGHTFAETHIGRACTECWRRWVDIRNVTLADIGKPNIAHSGDATSYQIEQIMREAAAENERIAGATLTAAGFGIGGIAAGDEAAA